MRDCCGIFFLSNMVDYSNIILELIGYFLEHLMNYICGVSIESLYSHVIVPVQLVYILYVRTFASLSM